MKVGTAYPSITGDLVCILWHFIFFVIRWTTIGSHGEAISKMLTQHHHRVFKFRSNRLGIKMKRPQLLKYENRRCS